MSTLATFISTLGFKMDGSFEQAMQTMAKRMSSLGSAMEASAKRSYTAQAKDMSSYGKAMYSLRDKEYKAAERLVSLEQRERNTKASWIRQYQSSVSPDVRLPKSIQAANDKLQAQVLKSKAAKMALSDKEYAAELKRINLIKDAETKVEALRILNDGRDRARKEASESRDKASRQVKVAKESQEALKAVQLKRKQSALAEEASRKELASMGDFYREKESDDAKEFARQLKYKLKLRQIREQEAADEARLNAKIQTDKTTAALKAQRVQQQEMSRLHSEALRENARREKEMSKRPWWAGGKGESRGGSGFGMGGIGGIPVRGHTTLGMLAGGYGIAEFARHSYQMANFNARMMPTLKFATKDEKKSDAENLAAANVEKDYINKEVKRLSLDRVTATQSYQSLLAATYKTLGSQGSQDLFTGIQQVGMMTGRSVDEMHRAIVGFQQIASKKSIMSEEVKGQIAEALLGSEQIFANALEGGDTKKFQAGMKAGKYTEKDLLKVAAEMKRMVSDKDLAEMMHTPEKMVTRLKNAWGDLLTASNDAGFWELMANGIESLTQAITDLTPHIKDIAGIIKGLSKFVWENKEVLIPFAIGLKAVTSGLAIFTSAKAAGNVLSMSAAFRTLGLSMVTAFMAPLAAIAAVMLALDTYEAYTQHKKGLVADFRENIPEKEQLEKYEKSKQEYIQAKKFQEEHPLIAAVTRGTNRKADALLGNLPDSFSIEKKSNIADELVKSLNGDTTGMFNLSKIRQDRLAEQRINTSELMGIGSAPYGTINITVQNTEPNVTKDWLSSVLPSVLGNALQQHVQKEAAFTPNMLLR